MNTQRSLVGKIARLPGAIREQLNRRLYDGQPGPLILPWLNALPAVQKILAAQFAGKPIDFRNLSQWRRRGFPRWLEEQKSLLELEKNSRKARRLARAARGLASGAAAIAANHLFESLQPPSGEKISTDGLLKILPSVNTILKAEQHEARLKLAKYRVRQNDARILLLRDKHQRDVAAISLRVLGDERAKLVEAAPISYEEKIELIGYHLFGEFWQPRLIPPPTGTLAGSQFGVAQPKRPRAPMEKGSAGVPPAASCVPRDASSPSPASATNQESATPSSPPRAASKRPGAPKRSEGGSEDGSHPAPAQR